MDDKTFDLVSQKTLDTLFEKIDEQIGDEYDVDYQDNIITIEIESDKVFVINKHAPMKQMWLSSPLTGAHHYQYQQENWVDTKSQETLFDLLKNEIQNLTEFNISI